MPDLNVYRVRVALVLLALAGSAVAQEATDDPLKAILDPELKNTVSVILETYRQKRKYRDQDFPMSREGFVQFRKEVTEQFVSTLGLHEWTVRNPVGKQSPLGTRFVDKRLRTIDLHGIRVEVHVIRVHDTGVTVPVVICLPPGNQRRAGVCVFSGHSQHGLRDLVLDLDSYQSGIAG